MVVDGLNELNITYSADFIEKNLYPGNFTPIGKRINKRLIETRYIVYKTMENCTSAYIGYLTDVKTTQLDIKH